MTDRNRTAFRSDGSMIDPVTVGQHLAGGYRLVELSCSICHHAAPIDVSSLDPSIPIPDISLRAKCQVCGSRSCTSRPDIVEYYRVMRCA